MKLSGNKIRTVHFWVPAFQGTGGIQRYSRDLVEMWRVLLPESNLRVLVKNDPPVADQNSEKILAVGHWPKGWRIAAYVGLTVWQTLRHRPDLIVITHLHFAPVASFLKRILGLRYWVALHGIELAAPHSERFSAALAGADCLLSVSRWTQKNLEQRFPENEKRVSLFANRIDENRFTPGPKPAHLLRRYDLISTQKIIFTVARLDSTERYKGYDRVIAALPRALRQWPDLHYILAGSGPDIPRIRALIDRFGLADHVTLTGFLPERDLNDHYNLCDLFVMPSDGEGFGIVFLEALACDRPVLAGNVDGSADALLDGRLGRLINPHDVEEIADTIVRMLFPISTPEPGFLRRTVIENFGRAASQQRLTSLVKA